MWCGNADAHVPRIAGSSPKVAMLSPSRDCLSLDRVSLKPRLVIACYYFLPHIFITKITFSISQPDLSLEPTHD